MDSKSNFPFFKFGQDVFWVALSNTLISLFGIITISALTKNYSVELFGVWSQIIITSSLLTPILTLHLGTASVRLLAAAPLNKYSQALSNMISIILLFILIIITIIWLFRYDISYFLFESELYVSYVPLTFIWAGTSALFAFMISFLRTGGEIKKLSFIRLIYILSKVAAIVTMANFNYSLTLIIISQITIDLVFIAIIYAHLINRVGFSSPNFLNTKEYLSLSLPDIPNGIIIWILNASDRYFITFYLGLSQVGIYSASYTLGSVLSMFYAPISFVLFPFLTKFWEENELNKVKNYLKYSLKYFLLLSIPAAGGMFLISKPLLNVLATSQYAIGGLLTFLVAIGTIFLGIYQINIFIIYLEKKNKYIPLITSFAAGMNILLNIILIPKIGMIGAAVSTIISYSILALIATFWAKKSLKYNLDIESLTKVISATIIMMFLLSFIKISGTVQIILFIIAAAIIYFTLLIIFKTFSKSEKRLIYQFIKDIKH